MFRQARVEFPQLVDLLHVIPFLLIALLGCIPSPTSPAEGASVVPSLVLVAASATSIIVAAETSSRTVVERRLALLDVACRRDRGAGVFAAVPG